MKRFFILICALGLALGAGAAPGDREMRRAVAEVRAAIDAIESAALESQSLEELNAAAREEVIRELDLSAKQVKAFDPIYKAYREALDRAIRSVPDPVISGEAAQRAALKERLANIAAVAQVKRDYVDRFAEVLTAEQIRLLYNTEGQIGTNIKRAAGESSRQMPRVLSGSGRRVTQDWGEAGDYTAIETGAFFKVVISPSARTITVTADDNVIDFLKLERRGGCLAFSLSPRSSRTRRIENLSISVVVPVSASLREIHVGSYAGVESRMPLRGADFNISMSAYGEVKADLVDSGRTRLQVSSYGTYEGTIECAGAQLSVASYGVLKGALTCTGTADVSVGSYGSLNGDIRAAQVNLAVSSGGKYSGAVKADAASLGVSSYAQAAGAIQVADLKVSVYSSGSLRGAFAGRRCEATVGSYGKLALTGSTVVEDVTVQLSSQGEFSAPDLRVKRYDIRASSYSKAEVWCSELLKIEASSSARVLYDGPGRLETLSDNIRRR
ncbi:DUF2807 domain-containing protein [uncultured Alistipes sp.]|uniref:GIN domain-containing protein n=1 Tax=uncultured Alistipes sp. TaxID=538949 RepID=UPI0025D6EFD6|nr:DUF2807 domain-containing protein [uncultured Alistipes sp.]